MKSFMNDPLPTLFLFYTTHLPIFQKKQMFWTLLLKADSGAHTTVKASNIQKKEELFPDIQNISFLTQIIFTLEKENKLTIEIKFKF